MSVPREQILKAAAELLSRRATASMDEIARSAGISRATLHRHFAGREALVAALGELGIRQIEEGLDAARIDEGDPAEALRRLIDEATAVAGFLAFLYGENELYESDPMVAGWARVDARVGALLKRGREEGVLRGDLSTAWLVDALFALVAASGWSVQDGRLARRDASRVVAELLLGGALERSAR
ncbi:TetR/AcrR family transcriptional regulator [Streptomyces chumphonensis]|uniref:TetR/AcrR family transcriptional regulator n=1 Tax=Streptomyces chumphonensis TaxID=1214925 RepID=A0A927IC79_9ACTN|nr:TetR/AcrR family transcriptional regulator [Streptomyces chumphonensis]MBD3931620.1 TetR/AcrR family transcriptional regulator [Streptomyces chumphonensis]